MVEAGNDEHRKQQQRCRYLDQLLRCLLFGRRPGLETSLQQGLVINREIKGHRQRKHSEQREIDPARDEAQRTCRREQHGGKGNQEQQQILERGLKALHGSFRTI
jgi:hypothetical protein